jgi:hypothetical protein
MTFTFFGNVPCPLTVLARHALRAELHMDRWLSGQRTGHRFGRVPHLSRRHAAEHGFGVPSQIEPVSKLVDSALSILPSSSE